jgi:hypothetical protein
MSAAFALAPVIGEAPEPRSRACTGPAHCHRLEKRLAGQEHDRSIPLAEVPTARTQIGFYKPNTYSTVDWRICLSSGGVTIRITPLGPDAIGTYCAPSIS